MMTIAELSVGRLLRRAAERLAGARLVSIGQPFHLVGETPRKSGRRYEMAAWDLHPAVQSATPPKRSSFSRPLQSPGDRCRDAGLLAGGVRLCAAQSCAIVADKGPRGDPGTGGWGARKMRKESLGISCGRNSRRRSAQRRSCRGGGRPTSSRYAVHADCAARRP